MVSFMFWGAEIPWNSERTVEYPWVEAHLVPPPARVLDVGCGYSPLPRFLVEKGYDAYGIDINEEWIPRVEGFKASGQDIRRTSFPDGFFDQVLLVSTLEHVGMDWYYNEWLDIDRGDFKAMGEVHRVLKYGGSVLVTVPYGDGFKAYRALRVYDDERIKALLEGFRLESSDFFVREGGKLGRWRKADRKEAIKVDCPSEDEISAITCFEAVNRGSRRLL
jgi:SAM-dependent methyltransferase